MKRVTVEDEMFVDLIRNDHEIMLDRKFGEKVQLIWIQYLADWVHRRIDDNEFRPWRNGFCQLLSR